MGDRKNLANQSRIVLPSYIPHFDGLRGIAILAVFVAHSEFILALPHGHVLQYGRIGVDLFFVLSGFLITGILLDSKGSRNYFRNFYMRRALRIWPLYYLILIIAFVALPLALPGMREWTSRQWPHFVFYIQNLRLNPRLPAALAPTWSLAVEEQFYMTWPLLVFLLGRRALHWTLLSAIGFSLALRITGFELHAPLEFIHNFTLSRLDPIAFGCLAALWMRAPGCTPDLWRRWSVRAIWIGLSGMLVCRILWNDQSTVVSYPFMALGFTGLLGIALVADAKKSRWGRFLVNPCLRYTGKISYGLYLIHMPLFICWRNFVVDRNLPLQGSILGNLSSAAIQFGLAFLLAILSWRMFESPLLRLKRYFPSGSSLHRPAGQIGLEASALLSNSASD